MGLKKFLDNILGVLGLPVESPELTGPHSDASEGVARCVLKIGDGTGFAIHPEYGVTCRHVWGTSSFQDITYDGKRYKAQLRDDKEILDKDIAVFKMEESVFKEYLSLLHSPPPFGQIFSIFGFRKSRDLPYGYKLDGSLHDGQHQEGCGYVYNFAHNRDPESLKGMSGGPVFLSGTNMVVGIQHAEEGIPQAISYIHPITILHERYPELFQQPCACFNEISTYCKSLVSRLKEERLEETFFRLPDNAKELLPDRFLEQTKLEKWLRVRGPDRTPGTLALDVIASNSALVIIGEPGAGKSVLMREVAIKYAENALHDGYGLLPILARVKELGLMEGGTPEFQLESPVIALLLKSCRRDGWDLNELQLRFYLKKGAFIILLDGLEDVNEVIRHHIVGAISEVTGAYDQNKYIVTVRNYAFQQGIDLKLSTMCLQPLEWPEGVKNMLSIFCKEESLAEEIHGYLESHPEFRKMAVNPLFLRMIAWSIESGAKEDSATVSVPINKGIIFTKCIEQYLHHGDESKNTKLKPNECRSILGHIAFSMQRAGKNVLTRDEFYDFAEKAIVALKDLHPHGLPASVDTILASQIIVEDGTRFEYAFWHASFREYFAASHIKREINSSGSWSFIDEFVDLPPWHDTLLLLSGLFQSSEQARDLVLSIFKRDIILAAKCLVNASQMNDSDRKMIARRFARKCKSGYYHEKRASAEALGIIATNSAPAELVDLLLDPDSGIRWRAAEALGKIGDRKVATRLLESILKDDEDPWVRVKAAEALGRLDQGSEKLLASLNGNQRERWYVIEAIGVIRCKDAVPQLVELLSSDDLGSVWRSAEALGKIGEPSVIVHLLNLKHPAAMVRGKVIDALLMLDADSARKYAGQQKERWLSEKLPQGLSTQDFLQ
jgi:HEAT repeat protein